MTRRFQFSLRALLIAVVFAATFTAYVAHDVEIVRVRNSLRRQFYKRSFCFQDSGMPSENREQLSWLRRLMGDRPVGVLYYEPLLDQTGNRRREVEKAFPEDEIWQIEEMPDMSDPDAAEPDPIDDYPEWQILPPLKKDPEALLDI